MSAEIGAPAPAFSLRDPSKEMVSLDDLKGRKTLLVFIPFPFTGNCEAELCTLRNGFGFPVLSDFWPHGEVCKAYGAFNEATGSANRTTFVLDETGVVRQIIATESLGVIREYDAYVEELGKI